ncbi:DUF1624 domain-containing protein [Candidatus Peregrinibacteria bacterium]|nr:MAG: DUF1624 domain-containing protein [Candidatus Peregrinibacteria bacterium]
MKRLIEIDALRGLAVSFMMLFHFLMSGMLLGFWHFAPYEGASLLLVRFGQFLFLGLVGVSVFLSQRGFAQQCLRGLRIFLCGLLVSLATYFVFPEQYVRFGVLHLIGVSVPVLVLFKGREGLGLGLAFFIYVFSHFLPEGGSVWGIPFGFPPAAFSSLDYFPIAPWLTVPFVGLWLGAKIYAKRQSTRLVFLARIPLLTWLGRHSLAVYLLHQPVLYFSLWALSHWIQT